MRVCEVIFLKEAISSLFESAEFPSYFKAEQFMRQRIGLVLFGAKFNQHYTGPEHAWFWTPSARAKTKTFWLVSMLVWLKFRKPLETAMYW